MSDHKTYLVHAEGMEEIVAKHEEMSGHTIVQTDNYLHCTHDGCPFFFMHLGGGI